MGKIRSFEERFNREVEKNIAILEGCADAVVTINQKGIIEFFNRAAEKLFGYGRIEVINKNVKILTPPEHANNHNQYLARYLATRVPRVIGIGRETEAVRKDGTRVPILLTISESRLEDEIIFTAFIKDISDRKIREAELAKLSIIASKTDNSIIVTDSKARVEWVNEAFTRNTGYTLEEMIGKVPGHVLQGKDTDQQTVEEIRKALKRKESISFELLNYKKDGEIFWVNSTINPIFNESGELISFISIHTDITERIKVMYELELERARADDSRKAKEIFLANMSHEIRTPMNAILGLADLLKKTDLTDKQFKFLDAITKSGDNLMVIINDILDFSKIDAGEVQIEHISFRLNTVIASIMNYANLKAKDNSVVIYPSFNTVEDMILIGDSVRLTQVVLNLVNNAIKFSKGKTVSIVFEKISSSDEGVVIRFSVSDTGIGIRKESFAHIFEEFRQEEITTTRKYGGTGLGLSISKKLVEKQGGVLNVESQIGKGSHFYFDLRFDLGNEEDLQSDSVKKKLVQKDALKGMRVLMAEDMEFNTMVVESLAEEWGCLLDVAENGKEAVSLLKKNDYDIVLMDIQMPVLGGVEATRKIRKGFGSPKKDIPIIALTANAIRGYELKYLEAGMNDTITKPFKGEDLLRAIIRNLGEKMAGRQIQEMEVEKVRKSVTPSAPLYDLSSLKEMSGGNVEFQKKMIGTFIQQSTEALENMEHLLFLKDFAEISKIAHRVKPSFQIMGVTLLHKLLSEIEVLASKGEEKQKVSSLVDSFVLDLPKVLEGLKKEKL